MLRLRPLQLPGGRATSTTIASWPRLWPTHGSNAACQGQMLAVAAGVCAPQVYDEIAERYITLDQAVAEIQQELQEEVQRVEAEEQAQRGAQPTPVAAPGADAAGQADA